MGKTGLATLAAAFWGAIAGQAPAQDLVGFDRADFGSVVLTRRQSGAPGGDIVLEAGIGSYRNEAVSRYSPDVGFRQLGRAVGRLDVLTDLEIVPCTAFIVSERYIVTNHHCVPDGARRRGASRIEGVEFVAGYVEEGVVEGARSFRVNPVPVEANAALDYAVLEVFGNPAREWGALTLSPASISEGRPFWIIGHPEGGAQRISREDCASASPALSGGRLRHTCDTLPGNSGSPVIDTDTRAVIALHHAGSRRSGANYAIPMADILAQSEILGALFGAGRTSARESEPGGPVCAGAARHFETAEQIGTAAALEAHVEFYGSCAFAPLAEAALAAMDEAPDETESDAPVADAPPEEEDAAPPVVLAATAPERCDQLAASPYDPALPEDVTGIEADDMDVRAAIRACREAVDEDDGDARRIYQLARAIEIGARDDAEAASLYRRSADLDYAAAFTGLGWLYENGYGVDQSDFEAAAWYRRGAERGDAVAMNNLGYFYEQGIAVRQSADRAFRWYTEAAEWGYPIAQTNLGWMYESEREDFEEAARWYLAAAEAGEPIGQGNIGWFYQEGLGVDQDDAEAARWYRAAADQGDARGQLNLGWMYENGRGVPQDDDEALRLYRLAADQDDERAMANVGWMYQYGRGVEADAEEAVRWYRRAAEAGDAGGQTNLGWMYEFGEGIEKDEERAAFWYRQAAEQGDDVGQVNYGWMLQEGVGVDQDDREAVYWYGRAAEQGNARAAVNLGWMYEEGRGVDGGASDEEAVRWYRIGAEGGNTIGKANLAYMLENGYGTEKDVEEAVRWYREAAAEGDERSAEAVERLER